MNEKQKKFLEEMQLKKPRRWFRFLDLNRKIYNSMCRNCQTETVKTGGNIDLNNICEVCKPKVKDYLEQIKILLEYEGAKIND